jgi:NAD(P)-dependent dehydrogenase (short-subunit alcohol dehydrogenase family)
MPTILISGAASGFGALTANALAGAGHTVYAGLRAVAGRNAGAAAAARAAGQHPVDLDVTDDDSVRTAVRTILSERSTLDVLVHNAGHMVTGPAEAFTPEQLTDLYDTNVVGTQRLNRAALPHMRERGEGLVVWVGSSSSRGGAPPYLAPYLAPYFAAKAGTDALAASHALELTRFGIETTIVVPGAFTDGTNHFAHSGHPADEAVTAAYDSRYPGLMDQVGRKLAELEPPEADPGEVARAIVRVVGMPRGRRPFRVHVDPSDDGAAVVNAVTDRVRAELIRRTDLAGLLHPTA